MPESVCSQETAENIARRSQSFTTYSEKYVPARQRFTADWRTSVGRSVGRLHLLTLPSLELRLVAQIVASDDTASETRSQHFSFVERQTARRTGSRHSRSQHRPRDTSVPGKQDHTVGSGIFSDDLLSRMVKECRYCHALKWLEERVSPFTYACNVIVLAATLLQT